MQVFARVPWRRLSRSVLITLAVVGTLTMMAPWHSDAVSVPVRAAFFFLCGIGWQVSLVGARLIARQFRPGWTGFRGTLLVVLLASVPASFGILAASRMMFGDEPALLPVLLQTLPVGLAGVLAFQGLFQTECRVENSAAAAAECSAPATEPLPDDKPEAGGMLSFLRTHAPDFAHRRLLALEAEDHYLRLHFEEGSHLVLLRLRDAVTFLGQEAGWQPHRSFWVARTVSARAERRGQSWQIVLENGLVVPVSRAAIPAMKASGLQTVAGAA